MKGLEHEAKPHMLYAIVICNKLWSDDTNINPDLIMISWNNEDCISEKIVYELNSIFDHNNRAHNRIDPVKEKILNTPCNLMSRTSTGMGNIDYLPPVLNGKTNVGRSE